MMELLLSLTPEERRALVQALEEAAKRQIPATDLVAYLSGFVAGFTAGLGAACK